MARPLTGSHRIRNGNVYLRVRRREWLAGPRDQWPDTRIAEELDRVVALVKAGIWDGPDGTITDNPSDLPTVQEAASDYLAHLDATNSNQGTRNHVRWLVEQHVVPYFGAMRCDQIKVVTVEAFVAHKQQEREYVQDVLTRHREHDTLTLHEQENIVDAGRKGLAPASINKAVDRLAVILDRVAEDYPDTMPPRNPARSKRVRVHVDKPDRTALSEDQTFAMFAGAKYLDETARADRKHIGREVMLTLLVCTGLRIGELCSLKRKDVNLEGARLTVTDAKTVAGVRDVEIGPYALPLLTAYMATSPTQKANDWLFPTTTGKKRDTARFRDRILLRAVSAGDSLLAKTGGAMPRVTPHTLRRTYATYCLANGENPRWVAYQMGHTDTTMIMSIYAQVMQRRGTPDKRVRQLMGPPGGGTI